MPKESKPLPGLSIRSKYMPKNIYTILLKKQGEMKAACGCQFSLEKTIYKIVKYVEDKDISQ